MLERVLAALRSSSVREIVVVLRAGDADGRRLAESVGVRAVHAEDPDEGRAASIRAGIRALPEDSDGILFALADQPFLESPAGGECKNGQDIRRHSPGPGDTW